MVSPYNFTIKPGFLPAKPNVTYEFETINGHIYAVQFVEATSITDLLDDYPVISNAIYVIIDVLRANGKINWDIRTGKTVLAIIRDYLDTEGRMTILSFNCSTEDGKQMKRHHKFDRWYLQCAAELNFEKMDEYMLEPDNDSYTPTYISILYAADHPRREIIAEELIKLRRAVGADKKRGFPETV